MFKSFISPPVTLQKNAYWQTLGFLLIIAIVLIFAGLGFRTPWPADEPRFTEVAREMVESGQWLFPMRGGELYPDKPPVFMWSIAIFYSLFGNLKIAFLLPSALVSLVTLICVYDISAKLWNLKVARNASLLLLLAPQFILQAKAAQIDAMVACWVTVAMYGFLRHFFVRASWPWYFASWAFMGLGIITKGVGFLPIFFLIPIFVLHYFRKYDFEDAISRKLWLGPIFMLLVIAAWLIPMLIAVSGSDNPDFIAYRNNLLFHQTASRYANSWHHVQPWYYFFLHSIPSMWFPLWIPLFFKSFWQFAKKHAVVIGLCAWIALVICFFSFSPGKRTVYILPALPALCIALSAYLTEFGFGYRLNRLFRGLTFFFAAVFILGGLCFLLHLPFAMNILLKELNDPQTMGALSTSGGFTLIALGLIWAGIAWKLNEQPSVVQFGLGMFSTWLFYGALLLAIIEPMRGANFTIMQNVDQIVGDEGEVGFVSFKEQFLLAAPMDITHFSYLDSQNEQEANAWQWMNEQSNRYIFTRNKLNFTCFDKSKAIVAGYGYGQTYILFDKTALEPTCPEPKVKRRYFLKAQPNWPEPIMD